MRDLPLNLVKTLWEITPKGVLINLETRGRAKAGDSAGWAATDGYVTIRYQGLNYYAHRIVWMLHNNSEIPEGMQIDHIDRDRSNNSPDNLRPATHSQNQLNRGALGCYYDKRERLWKAQINFDGKTHHLGYFDTQLDARKVYEEFAEELRSI